MRWYSESATEKPSDTSKPAGETSEAPKSEGDASSGLEAELKAKAAEVVDITVCRVKAVGQHMMG